MKRAIWRSGCCGPRVPGREPFAEAAAPDPSVRPLVRLSLSHACARFRPAGKGSSARAAGRFDRRRSRLPADLHLLRGRDRRSARCAACWSRLRLIERRIASASARPFRSTGVNRFFRRLRSPTLPCSSARERWPFTTRSRVSWCTASVRRPARTRPRPEEHDGSRGRRAPGGRRCRRAGPLHPWRLWKRRFSQAMALASTFPARAAMPCDPFLLARVKRTASQVGLSKASGRTTCRRLSRARRGAVARDGPPRAPRRRRPDDRLDRQCSLARAPARRRGLGGRPRLCPSRPGTVIPGQEFLYLVTERS